MNLDVPSACWAQAALIVDQDSLERMTKGGPREIDAFLLREIRWLTKAYMRTGDPRPIYNIGSSVAGVVMPIPGHFYSFQFSQLQALLAEMILALGRDANSLRTALEHLEYAIEVAHRVYVIDDAMIKAQVYYALLYSVTQKALGNFDTSINHLRTMSLHLTAKNSATEIDLIPLHRQETMMKQTVDGHRQLAESAVRYATVRPIEHYGSIKRVFEFLLNKGRVREAELILPAFKRAFSVIARKVAPISHISFLKNIGHYHMVSGETRKAAVVFRNALACAHLRGLRGQARQVQFLAQELETGSRQGKLVTFKAEDA